MASRRVNIQIDTRADTSGARQAETAIDSLSTANTRAATTATTAATSTGRLGQLAGQAGFQVQDFAIQVAGGTSALTAMAQQAPQFLGVFGPGGAIAGALISVGAIAAKVFLGMGDDAAAAKEEADVLADAIKDIGENAKKAIKKDTDFGLAKINAAKTSANELITAFQGVTAASNAAATASLTNAEKLREAEVEIRRLRGEQVDELEDIAANTAAESALRAEQARQEIAAQKEKVANAKAAVVAEQESLDKQNALKASKESQLETERQRLAQLREERDILQEIASKGYFEVTPEDVAALGMQPGTTSTQARDEAARRLEKDLAPQIGFAESNIEQLESDVADLAKAVTDSTEALASLTKKAVIAAQEIATAIPEIEKSFKADEISAQVSSIGEVATAAAVQVQEVIDKIKPANAAEAAALEALKPIVADKEVTANETLRTAQLLASLDSSIRTQMGNAATNIDKLLQTINTLNNRLLNQQRQIDDLNRAARSSGN